MSAKTANEREWLENQIIEQIRGMTVGERERVCGCLRNLLMLSTGDDSSNISREGAELIGGEPPDNGGVDCH